jgi:anti-sigma B factor antagonist
VSGLARVDATERDGVPIVRVRGEVDLSNADEVLRSIEGAVDGSARGLVVDLRGLEFFDSSGVRLLFQAARSAAGAGVRLVVLVARGSSTRRVLELAHASELFPLEDREESALVLASD